MLEREILLRNIVGVIFDYKGETKSHYLEEEEEEVEEEEEKMRRESSYGVGNNISHTVE